MVSFRNGYVETMAKTINLPAMRSRVCACVCGYTRAACEEEWGRHVIRRVGGRVAQRWKYTWKHRRETWGFRILRLRYDDSLPTCRPHGEKTHSDDSSTRTVSFPWHIWHYGRRMLPGRPTDDGDDLVSLRIWKNFERKCRPSSPAPYVRARA